MHHFYDATFLGPPYFRSFYTFVSEMNGSIFIEAVVLNGRLGGHSPRRNVSEF